MMALLKMSQFLLKWLFKHPEFAALERIESDAGTSVRLSPKAGR